MRMEVVEGGASNLVGRIPTLPRWVGKTRVRLSSALVAVEAADLSLEEATEDRWATEDKWLTGATGVTVHLEDMEGLEVRVSRVAR